LEKILKQNLNKLIKRNKGYIMEERLDLAITNFTDYINREKEQWENWEYIQNSDDYGGAGNYFGHSDDCFDAGVEYGRYLESLDSLDFLIKLKETLYK
jgi:hypothetical protein